MAPFELTIPERQTTGTATFLFAPENDSVHEGEETVTVSATGGGLVVTGAELALADDDAASTSVELSLLPDTVAESAVATSVEVTATLDAGTRPVATTLTVSVGDAADSAVADSDYAAVAPFLLTVPPAAADATATFTLTPEDDDFGEGPETVTVSGEHGSLTVVPAALTVTDDETLSTSIALSLDPEEVLESAEATEVEVTATLDADALATATTVTVTVGGTDDSATAGTDYEAVDGFELAIEAGSTAGTATFTFTPTADETTEGEETVTVSGTADLTVEPVELSLVETENGKLRLAGGEVDNEGRIEILYDGKWGTICDDRWDWRDADVACRQLGYKAAERIYDRSHFGGAVAGTPIHLDDLNCVGNEERLADCPGIEWGVHDCANTMSSEDTHMEDAGARCAAAPAENAEAGLVFDPKSPLTVGRGSSDRYWVRLASRPDNEEQQAVRVVVQWDGDDISVTPATWWRFPNEWARAEAVSVAVASDATAGRRRAHAQGRPHRVSEPARARGSPVGRRLQLHDGVHRDRPQGRRE